MIDCIYAGAPLGLAAMPGTTLASGIPGAGTLFTVLPQWSLTEGGSPSGTDTRGHCRKAKRILPQGTVTLCVSCGSHLRVDGRGRKRGAESAAPGGRVPVSNDRDSVSGLGNTALELGMCHSELELDVRDRAESDCHRRTADLCGLC